MDRYCRGGQYSIYPARDTALRQKHRQQNRHDNGAQY